MERWRRVVLLGMFAIILNFVSVHSEQKVFEERNVSNKSTSRPYNPREAWQEFNKHAAIEEKRIKKKRQRMMKTREMRRRRLPGPPGPRGPRGPPGGHMTKEELRRELQEMLIEAAIRKLQIAETQYKKEYIDMEKTKPSREFFPYLSDVDRMTITPKITWSFLWHLKDNVWINPNSKKEISNYYKPFTLGSHYRCQSLVRSDDSYNCQNNSSLDDGRYRVSKRGFYTFYVSFHISKIFSCEINQFDSIEVLLCINSQCKDSVSLRTRTNLKNSTFTVSINGILYLTKKQYASIYVDNNSSCSVKILRNSQVAGFLTGY